MWARHRAEFEKHWEAYLVWAQGAWNKTSEETRRWTYRGYLKTLPWRWKREKRLKYDDYQCARCGREDDLAVHHWTYENLGRENLHDLVTLCGDCHEGYHAFYEGEPEGRKRFFEDSVALWEMDDYVICWRT